jgi:hypothetical protein
VKNQELRDLVNKQWKIQESKKKLKPVYHYGTEKPGISRIFKTWDLDPWRIEDEKILGIGNGRRRIEGNRRIRIGDLCKIKDIDLQ